MTIPYSNTRFILPGKNKNFLNIIKDEKTNIITFNFVVDYNFFFFVQKCIQWWKKLNIKDTVKTYDKRFTNYNKYMILYQVNYFFRNQRNALESK